MKAPVTVKHLARLLQVSPSTVSRALQDHPRIGAETKARVVQLARELGYTPNVLSHHLRHNRSNAIGIIVPRIGYNFHSQAISGIEEVAQEAGYNLMICQSNEREDREVMSVEDLTGSRVAGLIVSLAGGTRSTGHFRRVLDQEIPLVFFDRVPPELAAPKVMVDNEQASFAAVEHLIGQGCRRIALLAGPPTLHLSNARMEGYRRALRTHHLPCRPDLIGHCDFTAEGAAHQTRVLLAAAEPPDALFAVSDRLAISAMTVIKERGLRIPEDVAIVGFGNDATLALVSPSLTTVDQDPFAIGREAARLFFRRLAEEESAPETKVIPTRLIVRESSLKGQESAPG